MGFPTLLSLKSNPSLSFLNITKHLQYWSNFNLFKTINKSLLWLNKLRDNDDINLSLKKTRLSKLKRVLLNQFVLLLS